MMSVSILILSEMLITFPIVSSLGIEFAEVFASPLKQASLSWLSCLPLLLVALVVSKTQVRPHAIPSGYRDVSADEQTIGQIAHLL